MGQAYRWLLPHPFLTLILVLVWVLLQNEVSAGMVVFGIILGIVIPRLTSIWWPDTPRGFRILKMARYSVLVIWDIIFANIQVAWIVLTVPNAKLKSAWIVVPLKLTEPEAITILAGTITLTPGTVSVELHDKDILVHALTAKMGDDLMEGAIDRHALHMEGSS